MTDGIFNQSERRRQKRDPIAFILECLYSKGRSLVPESYLGEEVLWRLLREVSNVFKPLFNLYQTLQICTMNSIMRTASRCLRSGAYKTAQTNRELLSGWARLMCSSSTGQKTLEELVKKDRVVIFMKGTPAQPMCGFSNAVVQILRMHGVDSYAAYNVLEDQDIRQGIKTLSNWPTIPQVFFNGEFVGGCDILLQMHQSGDLVEELQKLGIRSVLLDQEK
uniref:Glutaredoxin-related protein 5, mitochondrial n=1 Tax=Cyprinus carpio TaxID=7962 RepID=A0A8C2H8Y2_CYPCA